jgi:hypothetical protein
MSLPRDRSALFLAAAKADIGRLAEDDPAIARLALRMIRDLEAGTAEGVALTEMAKTGDLGDCRKLYFGTGKPPSHRIVYRTLDADPGQIEILEIIVIESRSDLYVYLLAANRLGRLPEETRPQYNRVHQAALARRAARKRTPPRA